MRQGLRGPVLEIRGGEVQAVRGDSYQFTGIDLAAVKADGELTQVPVSGAELRVSGGTLRTIQIGYGSTDAVRSANARSMMMKTTITEQISSG